MDVNARLMTTLDQEELLPLIMTYARELLDVEATSVWELNAEQTLLVLQAATGEHTDQLASVAVPIGQGIVGRVVATGERTLVSDVSASHEHYRELDQQSGFVTRSILCVPLRAPRIQLGPGRGTTDDMVIGAVQALNKRDGSDFSADDVALFEAFAHQAATALQTARLYAEMQSLFHDTISIIAHLVDARDHYTRGHSQRVATFAVAMATEMELDQATIYEIEIGGILHDVGKIGVLDAVLNKPGRLTPEEYQHVQQHPNIGYSALKASRTIQMQHPGVLAAVLEHHRRLDGSGYPADDAGQPISLIGQIMAVADVFDALTSERPYRAAWTCEQALDYLQERAGTQFNAECVAALVQARARGNICTQSEAPPEQQSGQTGGGF